MPRIFVVEDDPAIADAIITALRSTIGSTSPHWRR
jgi:hypothetical protein